MPLKALQKFIRLESSSGVLLVLATIVALVVSNSPLARLYERLLDVPLSIAIGTLAVDKPLLLWINDGLMAIFFLLIGLEVKREVLEGQLSSKDQLLLPAVAALGGFVVPAMIYIFFNQGDPEALGGWAVPAATDIAFALGVLMLLGSRVPLSLKVFLTSIAIFDDIAAIIVIAAFYTNDLSLTSLLLGALGISFLALLNRFGVARLAPYILTGIFVWICVLKSGVHATVAGFALGLTIPLTVRNGTVASSNSPLRSLEHSLHPWVAYAIMPIFAFANAGISFEGVDASIFVSPVALGIGAGLFLGKQIGIFACVWAMVKLGLARLPQGNSWLSIYGVSLLAGIGFTMSLFIGTLAFEHGNFEHIVATRVGVLVGSLMSATAGYLVLRLALSRLPERYSTREVQSE
jgi:NhaA family Na+:H+ antiporter